MTQKYYRNITAKIGSDNSQINHLKILGKIACESKPTPMKSDIKQRKLEIDSVMMGNYFIIKIVVKQTRHI